MTIAAIIQKAVATITNSPNARVTTPVGKYPNPQPANTPNAFFVFNISEESARAMITNSVWSSTAVTFQAMDLNPALPTYLFPVLGFAEWTTNEEVVKIIQTRWLEPDSIVEFRKLIAQFDDESGTTVPLTEGAILGFI
ncbi:hypothetical protein EWM64_g8371 [Hericium alpestre]|uniref:Uncharacterized protein n=1 Tax=Hericium alpestre TaxID=135208 RepID=A0A4Y9ZLJ2_9AGAM|nr:hypothetical protein EWM64_g8371 [Hericium alpestre]